MTAVYTRPEILTYDQIERIVMTSPQGQRALGMGIGAAMVSAAIDDMGKVKTRRRLNDWLDALGEPWFQQRKKARDNAHFDLLELEAKPEKSPLKDALVSLGKSLDAREAAMLEKYGKPETVDA